MSEPLWCDVRQHYCRCHDYGPRCDDYDDEDRLRAYRERAAAAEDVRMSNVSEQIAWYHQSHSREKVLWWVQERLDNCQSIASVKKGVDREGWMDDASYFAAILSLLTKDT